MKPEALAHRLADWVAAFTLDQAPEAAQIAGQRAILDTFGVMLAGARFNPLLAKDAASLPGSLGQATIFGAAWSTEPGQAALINGLSAHVLDFDDTSFAGIQHGSAVILPALLAVADPKTVSGRALLEGFIAASEVAYTLGDAAGDSLYEAGWHPTGLLSGIGAAAGVAKLLGGGHREIARAIALAACRASGLRAFLGTDLKSLMVGQTARQAVESGQQGFLSLSFPDEVFEGPNGFFQLISGGQANPAELLSIGQKFRLVDPGLVIKRRPLCSSAQPALDALEDILQEAPLSAQEVAAIDCSVAPMVARSLPYRQPENRAQAQFSLPFALACRLQHGSVAPAHLRSDCFGDRALQLLMTRVTVQDDLEPDLYASGPEAARINVTSVTGDRHEAFRAFPIGDPRAPINQQDLEAKFLACAGPLSPVGQTRELLQNFQSIAALPTIAPLFPSDCH